MQKLEDMIKEFYPYARKNMGFNKSVRVVLRHDENNAEKVLGKTAEYIPHKNKIVLYVTGRHPKDIMRSFSHELVHHTQNCRGDFKEAKIREVGYAQKNEHLREMEREAYEVGNLCFRDWEDGVKYGNNVNELDSEEAPGQTKIGQKLQKATAAASNKMGILGNSIKTPKQLMDVMVGQLQQMIGTLPKTPDPKIMKRILLKMSQNVEGILSGTERDN